jgi:hypothetical protein
VLGLRGVAGREDDVVAGHEREDLLDLVSRPPSLVEELDSEITAHRTEFADAGYGLADRVGDLVRGNVMRLQDDGANSRLAASRAASNASTLCGVSITDSGPN